MSEAEAIAAPTRRRVSIDARRLGPSNAHRHPPARDRVLHVATRRHVPHPRQLAGDPQRHVDPHDRRRGAHHRARRRRLRPLVRTGTDARRHRRGQGARRVPLELEHRPVDRRRARRRRRHRCVQWSGRDRLRHLGLRGHARVGCGVERDRALGDRRRPDDPARAATCKASPTASGSGSRAVLDLGRRRGRARAVHGPHGGRPTDRRHRRQRRGDACSLGSPWLTIAC